MTTALIWHERMMWFDSGAFAGPMRADGWVQPGEASEDPEAKRRIKNLLDATGFSANLDVISPRPATESDIRRVHSDRMITLVRDLSANSGGQLGASAFTGTGGMAFALLSAGATMAAADAVMTGRATNAYSLTRPPGHHACPDGSMGFCLFNNIAVAIRHVQATYDVRRVAVIDWDVHHGNGTQTVFYCDPSVLTISLHQDGLFPQKFQGVHGSIDEQGVGPGAGFSINIPLPAGSGTGAYRAAFDRIVLPALHAYCPDMLFVACGLDAGNNDPLGRMCLGPEDFRWMTAAVIAAANELCGGRIVISHEGGYHAPTAPFLALPIFEELVGKRSGVENPLSARIAGLPPSLLTADQAAAVEVARAAAPLLRKNP